MDQESRAQSEAPSALSAGKWLFARVGPLMPNEDGLLLKAFPAVIAGEWLLLHGDLLMFDQR